MTTLPTNVSTGTSTWRIAKGKICTGREIDGTYRDWPHQERDRSQMVGIPERWAIYSGTTDSGDTYEKIEVILLTADGRVRLTCDRSSSTSSTMLMRGLACLEPGDTAVIEVNQAVKANAFGSKPTFVSVYRWNDKHGAENIVEKSEWAGEKLASVSASVEAAFRAHPLYKDKDKPESEKTEFDFFQDLLDERGWKPYRGNEAAWLKVFNGWLEGAQYDQIASIDPDDQDDEALWTLLRQLAHGVTSDPLGAKAPAKKPLPTKKPVATEEEDPFADE